MTPIDVYLLYCTINHDVSFLEKRLCLGQLSLVLDEFPHKYIPPSSTINVHLFLKLRHCLSLP